MYHGSLRFGGHVFFFLLPGTHSKALFKMFHPLSTKQGKKKSDSGSMEINSVPKCDTCAAWAWHVIRVQPGWAQLVWMSYLFLCFVRKLTSCEFAAEPSIWPWLSGDDSLAERELAGAAALLWRQMLRASPRLSGDHHCFLWAPLCLVLWSVPLITACLPAFFHASCQSTH